MAITFDMLKIDVEILTYYLVGMFINFFLVCIEFNLVAKELLIQLFLVEQCPWVASYLN